MVTAPFGLVTVEPGEYATGEIESVDSTEPGPNGEHALRIRTESAVAATARILDFMHGNLLPCICERQGPDMGRDFLRFRAR
jgi:hypothetical protein